MHIDVSVELRLTLDLKLSPGVERADEITNLAFFFASIIATANQALV